MWKRFGSDRPQQNAAARSVPSLATRAERHAAVDRNTCSRLLSSGSEVRVLPGACAESASEAKPSPQRADRPVSRGAAQQR
jgi:hypothetical protein